jgi:hypothetical protein
VGTTTLELVTLRRSVTMSWPASGQPAANTTHGTPHKAATNATASSRRHRDRVSGRGILVALDHREVLGDWPERKRREKRRATDDDNCADKQSNKLHPIGRRWKNSHLACRSRVLNVCFPTTRPCAGVARNGSSGSNLPIRSRFRERPFTAHPRRWQACRRTSAY